MIPLAFRTVRPKAYPQFRIPRLLVGGQFEPRVRPANGRTDFSDAIIDTGSGYVIIPYKVHHPGLIQIHRDHGLQPYRLPSMTAAPVMQRLVEVGSRFLVVSPKLEYRPVQYVRVTAYFLGQNIRPADTIIIGLDAIRTQFPLYLDATRAFFLEPGDSLTVP
jgi:hypothetical protein